MDHATWLTHDARIDAEQVPDAAPLLDRLSQEFIASLTPREALALKFEPSAYLRARQLPPADPDWLTWVLMTGRGWGKSYAAAAWIAKQLQSPGDVILIAPTLDDCWVLQYEVIRQVLPPWVRTVERVSRNQVLLPDHGSRVIMHSAYTPDAVRGLNARAAWCEEASAWIGQGEIWRNLQRALRARGETPARAVFTLTPPREIGWLLDLCVQPTTRVTRGTARDNTATDPRNIESWYREMAGTVECDRELDGRVCLGQDGALFRIEDIEAARVQAPPHLDQIVVACDPAMSNGKFADSVGLVCLGISGVHLYVLASCSEKLAPVEWADRAISWASKFCAGRFVVENSGAGMYPKATLEAQMRIANVFRRPVVESPARGSKADRAQPLSAMCAGGRLHLVGRHEQLERDLTRWYPGASWSPGALDAIVHGAALLTFNGIKQ